MALRQGLEGFIIRHDDDEPRDLDGDGIVDEILDVAQELAKHHPLLSSAFVEYSGAIGSGSGDDDVEVDFKDRKSVV